MTTHAMKLWDAGLKHDDSKVTITQMYSYMADMSVTEDFAKWVMEMNAAGEGLRNASKTVETLHGFWTADSEKGLEDVLVGGFAKASSLCTFFSTIFSTCMHVTALYRCDLVISFLGVPHGCIGWKR